MSEKSITPGRRWNLFICDVCGEKGWHFGAKRCNKGDGTHQGRHHGPVEVMPVEDHLQALGEAEAEAFKLKDRADSAERWAKRAEAANQRADDAESKAFDQHVMVGEAHTQLEEVRQKLQTITAALEVEVERLRRRERNCGSLLETARPSSLEAHVLEVKLTDARNGADRLQTILDQAETAGAE